MQGTIHRLTDGPELVCRVQTDLGVETPYVLCAPVIAREQWGRLVPKLHISVKVAAIDHVIVLSQMIALPASVIGTAVADASELRDDLVAGVDLLVTGF